MRKVRMAEGWSKKVPCKFFLNGNCRLNETCRFSHAIDSSSGRNLQACQFFLRGSCPYGSECWYQHAQPQNQQSEELYSSSSPLPINLLSRCNDEQQQTMLPSKNVHSTKYSLKNQYFGKNGSWADAPEFVPNCFKESEPSNSAKGDKPSASYAQIAGIGTKNNIKTKTNISEESCGELCPFYMLSGTCRLGKDCPYVHGLFCEVCQLACLHPNSEEKRKKHIEECTRLMEDEMEHSFAVARSRDKVCGICMDIVMDRELPSQRRFGILPNCCHCFCLDCIRKWRQSKQFENKIIRSCPECRTKSDYVIPSRYWVDEKDETKKDLVESYKQALSSKHCKYFKQGQGECPFGNKCFYLHALPDGTIKDVGPPVRKKRLNADGELQLYVDDSILWDFIEGREQRLELLRRSIETVILELEAEDLLGDLYLEDNSLSEVSDL